MAKRLAKAAKTHNVFAAFYFHTKDTTLTMITALIAITVGGILAAGLYFEVRDEKAKEAKESFLRNEYGIKPEVAHYSTHLIQTVR